MTKEEELNELEAFFNSIELPDEIQLNKCTKIINVRECINDHLVICRWNKSKYFEPYINRLRELKTKLNK